MTHLFALDAPRRDRRPFPTVGVRKPLLARYRREGLSTDETVGSLLPRVAARWPWLPAVAQGDHHLDYAQAAEQAERVAGWLAAAGVRPGDVVMWQLPNWWEAYVLGFAIWQLGAVSNPVMPFYREHELRQLVSELQPDVVIAPQRFRDFSHVDLFETVLAETGIVPRAKIVVRGSAPGWSTYVDVVAARRLQQTHHWSPDDVVLLLHTSGTTSEPKAAMHSSRSLLSEARQATSYCGWTFEDRAYVASPLAHMAGMLRGMICPAYVGGSTVLAERWDAELAVRDLAEHRVTVSGGATVFLRELTEVLRATGTRPLLKMWSCGGASVPPDVLYAADDAGVPAFRLYGMTELPTVSLAHRLFPRLLRAETDGMVAPGVEVVTVDRDGQRLPSGSEGELVVRGPERMLGYVDASANEGVLDADGWIYTGDLGVVDTDGVLRVTGRLKDVVNRGGEKISARELEDLLVCHPSVMDAAIVPVGHPRFGEVPAAFIVLRAGESLDEGVLATFLRVRGLPQQKLPEQWHVVDALPRTQSGKVKKAELAERLTVARA